ncbi:MAG: hypothetical protein M1838_004441 [Thelocarpon superellum]|nr:MAG: hypothetical protein M1838_004441 [Thelocarpon superellum]
MYRLAADVFNDAAIVLDCVSPALPKLARVGVLSLASVLRALCGVAAGSSKASLSAHFAKWGNLGELNAKDSSQETIISLMGMLAGSVVVSYVSSPMAVWSWLVLLLSIHLATNRAAVQAVSMHTLNRQRANIVLSHLVEDDVVLRPKDVSKSERIFEWDGVLRWKASAVLGSARIGVQLREVIASTAGYDSRPGSIHPRPGARVDMDELARVYHQEQYLLWCDQTRNRVLIVLKEGATPVSQLKAWMQALLTVRYFTQRARAALGREPKVPDDDNDAGAAAIVGILRDQLRAVDKDFDGFVARLREAGWDVDAAALETRSGWRVCISPGPS